MHGKEVRLFKLRNPWGKEGEWNGDWGDGSPLWTEEIKKLVDYEDRDDGIFYISLSDYLQNFELTGFLRQHDHVTQRHSHYMHKFGDQVNHQAFFEFTLNQEVDTKDDVFSVMTYQQGPKLQNHKSQIENQCF